MDVVALRDDDAVGLFLDTHAAESLFVPVIIVDRRAVPSHFVLQHLLRVNQVALVGSPDDVVDIHALDTDILAVENRDAVALARAGHLDIGQRHQLAILQHQPARVCVHTILRAVPAQDLHIVQLHRDRGLFLAQDEERPAMDHSLQVLLFRLRHHWVLIIPSRGKSRHFRQPVNHPEERSLRQDRRRRRRLRGGEDILRRIKSW